MKIKSHLCGIAVAYEPQRFRKTDRPTTPRTDRPQGSRYGQQKRKIADACEYMRRHGKALVFVATTPGYTAEADERRLIQALTHNLRNGYGIEHYVWVRESTKKGFPHFHFVVNARFIDALKLSVYWSSLFGSDATNSIRLGSKPGKNGKRIFFIRSDKQVWYLTKYLGKGLDGKKEGKRTVRVRSFAVSQKLAELSKPEMYEAEIVTGFTNLHTRIFTPVDVEEYVEAGRSPPVFNPYRYSWWWTGHGQTYIGRPKEWKNKTSHKNVNDNE